jgi:integrase
MSSVFKPAGSDRYVIVYRDENNKRRKKYATRDKAVSERIARNLENRVALRREGLVDPREEAFAEYASKSLLSHVDDWKESIRSRGGTLQHVKQHCARTMRIVALIKGAKLGEIEAPKPATKARVVMAELALRSRVATSRITDLTADNVQKALSRLIEEGRSLQTANHHRNAVKSFVKWMHDTGRMRENTLRRVSGFNVKEDPRHERRTVSLEELRRLIDAAHTGNPFKRMTGPMRALCYRLAVDSGLRYSEIGSIKPESFDWRAGTVTIHAAYAKNGETVSLPMKPELAADLARYVAGKPAGKPVFPLPHDKGAAMVRKDLEAAGIPYRDAGGLVFDFHSLRCQLATNADAAGVSPRVVQRLMRHSKLEMTGRYTRPRAVDLENAAMMLPSLKPAEDKPEALAATGTDGKGTDDLRATTGATTGAPDDNDDRPNTVYFQDVTTNGAKNVNPLVEGSSPSPVIHSLATGTGTTAQFAILAPANQVGSPGAITGPGRPGPFACWASIRTYTPRCRSRN